MLSRFSFASVTLVGASLKRPSGPLETTANSAARSSGAMLIASWRAFFTFSLSGPIPPKEMGIVLGVAVLLDAFLVRLVLMPVRLSATGKWAWYLPRWVDRILPDVRFGH